MKVRFDTAELDTLLSKVDGIEEDIMNKITPVFRTEINKIAIESRGKVPVKSGNLQNSMSTKISSSAAKLSGIIEFGGGVVSDYASIQHENEIFSHASGKQAHWLYGDDNSAYEKNEDLLIGRIEKEIYSVLEKL